MKAKTVCVLLCLLAGGILTGCPPSQAELDARASQTAAADFATQTAAAPTPTKTPIPTPTPTPTPTPPAPDALLESSSAALREAGSFHFDFDMQMSLEFEAVSMDVPLVFTGDFQQPDSMQAKMTMSVMGMTLDVDMIKVGETTYVTNPMTGEWEVTEQSAAPLGPDTFASAGPGDLEDLTFVGEETLDGTRVYRLAGTLPLAGVSEVEGELQVEYWIGAEDALLLQMAATGEMTIAGSAFGAGSESGTATITMTMQLSDFGKKVEIEAPRLALYRDDFADPTSGWTRDASADYIADYEDGGYRIFVNAPDYSVWSRPDQEFADVSIEVTATKIGGPDDNNFGLICRYQDASNFYALLISSDGFYGVLVSVDNEWQFVGMDILLPSVKINQGARSNDIRADCVGDRLSLYVNGELLVRVTDDTLGSGDVGLIAGTFGEAGVDILFDDFVVYQPPATD